MLLYWHRFKQTSFFVKWTNWEYYPVTIANIPTVLFWLLFAIRSRDLFFFTKVNPAIETGGVLGESKINILNRIPPEAIPKTLYIKRQGANTADIVSQLFKKGIQFPIVAKPNVGERGFLVQIIKDEKGISDYLKKVKADFIIQDFVDYPLEISVLYYRFPDEETGHISSICIKKNLTVTGDGKSTIQQLMQSYPRARFQLDRFEKDYKELLDVIPEYDEEVLLEPIGNHSRGTTFLNGNEYITEKLVRVFDKIGINMDGIYYGRFDMKCQNMQVLKAGKEFKILEFNGIASEPAHIYDPTYSVLQAYKDIWAHWKIIYRISKVQDEKGVPSMTLKEAWTSIQDYRKYLKMAKA